MLIQRKKGKYKNLKKELVVPVDIEDIDTEWYDRQLAIDDICRLFTSNGYYPSIIENRKARTIILALCEHGKISNYEYNIISIDRKGKKLWEWNRDWQHYYFMLEEFKREDFCDICNDEDDLERLGFHELNEEEMIEEERRLFKERVLEDIKKGKQETLESWLIR